MCGICGELKFKEYSFNEEKLTTLMGSISNRGRDSNGIFRNDDFELILLCWLPNQMAPIHGHEGEKCWFKVINGSLKISNYSVKSLAPLKLNLEEKITASEGYLDGPADIHSIENCSNKPVITLHIYANPYDTCTVYNLKEKRIDKLKMNYHSIDGKLC